uniref:Uncharacterized protein n=1 Tax=Suricata suricatta TaxID=37032 RepID=A0A673VLS7_SURSU
MLEGAELYFNVDHGYLEGLVRGCKAGLLTQQDYINLVQCETLEDEPLRGRCRDAGQDCGHGVDLNDRQGPFQL